MSTWKKFSRIVYWAMRFIPVLVILVAPTVSIEAQSPSPKLNPPPDYPNQPDGSIAATLPPLLGSGVIHLNGTAFVPQSSSIEFDYSGVGLVNRSVLPATFLASLSLPNRAQIKQVIFVYWDSDPAGDISMFLEFQPFDYVGSEAMAWAHSSGAENFIRYSVVTDISNDIVDNATNTYLLTVTLPSDECTFISARIEYSYNAFVPMIQR